ncbi:HigA family addiction module antitoxin [Chromohalobacter canadensis]|uniref:HigA family addiction module antitoxin n=1 Tax=Chromohalobacter canadensis TaxID=141389 RepID=A0ABZ0Y7C7_9GAMM|nr:HigA family addiction module antitoxin [Chromohalobacter canadensis]MCK0770312.1 HigA family addiction module antitoxin [Chromohalobacter canadensis]WQH07776.1 HigA family addiction module antitoxin [Chromohalobacter canadensis]
MRQPTGNSSLAITKPLDGWSHAHGCGRQTWEWDQPEHLEVADGTYAQPPHPGETLREDVLPALGINVTEMAHRLGLSQKMLLRVLRERAPISSDLAVRLERAGIGRARTWLAVQGDYDDWQAEHPEPYSPGTEPDN